MATINILFVSIEGNTRAFINNLAAYGDQQATISNDNPNFAPREITEQTDFQSENQPFFAFVPTYLNGGNGIDSGVTELMTTVLGEYIGYGNNQRYCLGVIGSGNRNFNEQYCLTARRYAQQFHTTFLADYELRGTSSDVERVYGAIKEAYNNHMAEQ